jgi:sugar transferase EpsL
MVMRAGPPACGAEPRTATCQLGSPADSSAGKRTVVLSYPSNTNERVLKRLFDLSFSALGLFLLGPLMALVAMAVCLESRGPAVVTHRRLGRNGKPFGLCRFRTRSINPDAGGGLTEFGRLLEETGLADLPQLWNIMKGDLSVVGPEAVSTLGARAFGAERLFSVRPGIFSPAAPHRSNERRGLVSAQQRFVADVWCVQHRSTLQVLEILVRKSWQEVRRTLLVRSEKC